MTAPVEETVRTLRYRAVNDLAYPVALIHLLEYARETREVFEYGPMLLDAIKDQGLTVSGSRLEGVIRVLADVPGLYLSEE